MTKYLSQLPLSLSLKDDATFDNFFLGKNVEIITELKKAASGQGEKLIYLYGASGLGASHLLQACCHYAHQYQRSSVYLPFAELVSLSPEILIGLESLSLLCFDDLQVTAGHNEWQEAIFHLFNRVYDLNGQIIMAANQLPKLLNLQLADLVSRFEWSVIYHIHPLTDDEKQAVLIMRAHRRGIDLSEEVIKYLLTHYNRHIGTLLKALDVLDQASLSAKRRLTVPFVKEILQI